MQLSPQRVQRDCHEAAMMMIFNLENHFKETLSQQKQFDLREGKILMVFRAVTLAHGKKINKWKRKCERKEMKSGWIASGDKIDLVAVCTDVLKEFEFIY